MKLAVLLVLSAALALAKYPDPRYFTTDQDHYDGSNINTWQQAYYVNDTFFVPGSSAPVFLCVGGEGPALDGSAVVDSVHCNVAVEWLQETKALMFAVEHRYYGCHNASACPVKDTRAPGALKFLSSRQALGDLAAFHAFATRQYNLTDKNRWVSWGGSYPGMLAGWFRLKYPHLVWASVSSSAPVHAQLDMACYNDVNSQAYTVHNNGVQGSAACQEAIRSGHSQVGTMLQSAHGRSVLAQLFNLTSPEWLDNPTNQLNFAGYGVANFPAQSNDPACTDPACDINKICAIMTNTTIGDEVSRLAEVRAQQSSPALLAARRPPSKLSRFLGGRWSRAADTEVDYWGYQTCTEFGFYQTCEVGSKCFFTQGLDTLASQTQMCPTDFGVPVDKVTENIAYTNEYYGSIHSAGSRILSVNGEVDPWHCLAILEPPNDTMPVIWVPGASHHAWTHPTLPTDQPSVIQAREMIKVQVAFWLKMPPDSK